MIREAPECGSWPARVGAPANDRLVWGGVALPHSRLGWRPSRAKQTQHKRRSPVSTQTRARPAGQQSQFLRRPSSSGRRGTTGDY
jgi:hypothetical protein